MASGLLHPCMLLYAWVTWWSPRACHYNTLRRAHRFPTCCIGWRKNNHIDHLISYLDPPKKTGSESFIEMIMRGRWLLFVPFVARMEDTRLPKCVLFGELVGGADCMRGERKKIGWGVSWTTSELSVLTPISGRLQHTRGGMAQDGGTRGGIYRGKMDRCGESQGWTTTCIVFPNVTGRTKERIA